MTGAAWIRASAWGTLALVAFQLGALALAAGSSSQGWSVSTLAQAAVAAVLAVGAFRHNLVALTLLGLLGVVRIVLFAMTLNRMLDGSGALMTTRLMVEIGVTIPVAILWVAGGVAAFRSRRTALLR